MKDGDTIEIKMLDKDGNNIFGTINQGFSTMKLYNYWRSSSSSAFVLRLSLKV